MGNEDLGLKYDTEDGKPVCVIYEHGEIATKVPVVLPSFIFEVHNSKLFWHDRGSGDWFETTRFWSLRTDNYSGLTDWKAAELIARIDSNHLIAELVAIRCRKCNFIFIVGLQSTSSHREKCVHCIRTKVKKVVSNDE